MSTEGYKYRPEYPALMENGQIPKGLQSVHKEGMLRVAHEAFERGDLPAGVVVPKIFGSLDEAVDSGQPFWMRGFYPHFVDGFAVDTLPTTKIEIEPRLGSDNREIAEIYSRNILERADIRHRRYKDTGFFQRNFGVDPGQPQFFFQEDAWPFDRSRLGALHMTVINDGDTYYFDTAISPIPPRGAGSFQITKKTEGDPSFKIGAQTTRTFEYIAKALAQKPLDDIQAIIKALDQEYRKGHKTGYNYKLDLQVRPEAMERNDPYLTLLQARIVTVNGLQKPDAQKRLDEMISNRTEIIEGEMATLPIKLTGLIEPTIIRLVHNHRQVDTMDFSMYDPQLQNIAGVQVPPCFDRGILSHGGYGVVAYANYWGIPFVFAQ